MQFRTSVDPITKEPVLSSLVYQGDGSTVDIGLKDVDGNWQDLTFINAELTLYDTKGTREQIFEATSANGLITVATSLEPVEHQVFQVEFPVTSTPQFPLGILRGFFTTISNSIPETEFTVFVSVEEKRY